MVPHTPRQARREELVVLIVAHTTAAEKALELDTLASLREARRRYERCGELVEELVRGAELVVAAGGGKGEGA